jgi:predicted transcriptional regulator
MSSQTLQPSPNFSAIQTRALSLLSSGVTADQTALALGLTPSAISQMVSDEIFAGELAKQKFEALRKHNARDDELDALEDQIIESLKQVAGMVMDPLKLTRMLAVINAAKRRGASSPEQVVQKQTIIKLNLPVTLMQKFVVNANNQVVSVGAQDLVTIQSSRMKSLANESTENGHARTQELLTSTGAGN